jgi:predicted O-methyltransferase YrrM
VVEICYSSEPNTDRLLKLRGLHYKPMYDYLCQHECFNILEIGTNNGTNAVAMIKNAGNKIPENKINYYGFDLFEDLTSELADKEFSFKSSDTVENVKKTIESFTSAKATLFKGDTNDTLAKVVLPFMDLIYIDGGHTLETISNDWNHCCNRIKPNGVIFLDDYFTEMPFVGCKYQVDKKIDKNIFDVEILPIEDVYAQPWGCLITKLVMVKKK